MADKAKLAEWLPRVVAHLRFEAERGRPYAFLGLYDDERLCTASSRGEDARSSRTRLVFIPWQDAVREFCEWQGLAVPPLGPPLGVKSRLQALN
jgi:hypothetical protein